MSPRQRMINLMYVVLTALLALNVSSDVLDGFDKVHKGVSHSNEILIRQNTISLNKLNSLAENNPSKALFAYRLASEISFETDSLYELIDSLKWEIAKETDGTDGNPMSLRMAENLEAASVVLLNPIKRNGEKLKKLIKKYKTLLLNALGEESNISGDIHDIFKEIEEENWEYSKFHNQPSIAAITLLSQIQNNLRVAEGETLRALLSSVDASDQRFNEMSAFVLPKSTIVMQGADYEAQIILAAVDSTDLPVININGKTLNSGENIYRKTATTTGINNYEGILSIHDNNGNEIEYPFNGSYNVIEPYASISFDLTNVLYAGIENPVSIAVPGIALSDISISASNAQVSKTHGGWTIKPESPDKDVEITVFSLHGIETTTLTRKKFRVRRLPDPSAYVTYRDHNGSQIIYKGGRPISKNLLQQIDILEANIDDGILNIPFKVNSFETVFFDSMGNAMVEISEGEKFSKRQKEAIRRLGRGKRLYISKISVSGADGSVRTLAPMEIIVN